MPLCRQFHKVISFMLHLKHALSYNTRREKDNEESEGGIYPCRVARVILVVSLLMVRTYFSHFSCHGDLGSTKRETTGMGNAVANAINQMPAIINFA